MDRVRREGKSVKKMFGEAPKMTLIIGDRQSSEGFVSRLVEKLEHNPDAILAFADRELVKGDGSRSKVCLTGIDGVIDRVQRGLYVAGRQPKWWLGAHGVFRSSAAKRMGGPKRHLAGEVSADWPWVLGMALLGEFVRVPEVLYEKIERGESVSRSWNRDLLSFAAVALACAREVRNSPLSFREELRLYSELAMVWWQGRESFSWRRTWRKRRDDAIRKIAAHIPAGETLILVDQDEWKLDEIQDRTLVPFLEKDGRYWGPPPSDKVALEELARLRKAGAKYIVICWPAFWWVDRYAKFYRYLQSNHSCIFESKSLVIFDLT